MAANCDEPGLGELITVKEAVRKMKRNRTPPKLMTKLRWMESDHQQVIALACWGTVQRSLLSTRLDHLNIKGEKLCASQDHPPYQSHVRGE